MNHHTRILVYAAIFAIAMGFLESAVVVYLRAIYYPEGFAFPLRVIEGRLAITEILREFATMVMLLSIGLIAVKGALKRFAVFIFAFAIWDIFYYIFLYLLIGWPQSLMTWDLLFLIPLTWVGPVLAPVINSVTMIILAVLILFFKSKDEFFRLNFIEWFLLIVGSFITIFGYTYGYLEYMMIKFPLNQLFTFFPSQAMVDYSVGFVPVSFNWWPFIFGEVMFAISILLFSLRLKRK